MNEPTVRLENRPEVTTFVARVRDRLADLTDEEREELVGGLEGDIHELVEDGGSVAELGDPRAYADELRLAAGLGPARSVARSGAAGRLRRTGGERVDVLLDGSRRRWTELVSTPALRGAWDVAVALRPLWWVARAWAAVQLVSLATGSTSRPDLLPHLVSPLVGALVLAVAVVVSVQIGRGRQWPGTRLDARGPRLLLLGLNAFAVLVLLVVLPLLPTQEEVALTYEHGYSDAAGGGPGDGLVHRGRPVENLFPYDADGNPLVGVQLFDQDGNRVDASRSDWYDDERVSVAYPWLNGGQRLFNVYPLPVREQNAFRAGTRPQPDAWTSANPPVVPTPPLAAVPPVSLPEPTHLEKGAQDDDPQEAAPAGRATGDDAGSDQSSGG